MLLQNSFFFWWCSRPLFIAAANDNDKSSLTKADIYEKKETACYAARRQYLTYHIETRLTHYLMCKVFDSSLTRIIKKTQKWLVLLWQVCWCSVQLSGSWNIHIKQRRAPAAGCLTLGMVQYRFLQSIVVLLYLLSKYVILLHHWNNISHIWNITILFYLSAKLYKHRNRVK